MYIEDTYICIYVTIEDFYLLRKIATNATISVCVCVNQQGKMNNPVKNKNKTSYKGHTLHETYTSL